MRHQSAQPQTNRRQVLVVTVANTVIEGAHVPDPVLDVLDPDADQLQEDIVVDLETGDAPILVTVEIEDGLRRSPAPGLVDIVTAHVREAGIIGEVIMLGQGLTIAKSIGILVRTPVVDTHVVDLKVTEATTVTGRTETPVKGIEHETATGIVRKSEKENAKKNVSEIVDLIAEIVKNIVTVKEILMTDGIPSRRNIEMFQRSKVTATEQFDRKKEKRIPKLTIVRVQLWMRFNPQRKANIQTVSAVAVTVKMKIVRFVLLKVWKMERPRVMMTLSLVTSNRPNLQL